MVVFWWIENDVVIGVVVVDFLCNEFGCVFVNLVDGKIF